MTLLLHSLIFTMLAVASGEPRRHRFTSGDHVITMEVRFGEPYPAPGASLQTTKVTESLARVATAWYQSTGSAQYGSQLMLVLPFTASQGSVDAVGSVSVVLKNAQGSSPAANGTF